jgi:hypothetical protein
MRWFARGVLALTALPVAGFAETPPRPPTPLSEVVVVPGPGPKVVETFPAAGSSAPAGVTVLKITFDQAMTGDAWSYGRVDGAAFPNCLARPRLLADQHSFALLCTLAPDQVYAISINETPDFASDNGRSAKAFLWRFTTAGVGARNLHDALAQAGLADADEPIMRSDNATGVSNSSADPAPQP